MSGQARMLTTALAVFAAWSLLVLLLAQAGLGGRYSLHPDDPARVDSLPALKLDQARSALGSLEQYAVVSARPLFSPDRRPLPVAAAAGTAQPAAAQPLDVVLTSVIVNGDQRVAAVFDKKTNKSQSLKVGDALKGEQSAWKLAELDRRSAVFEGPGGRVSLALRVFDGQGGEAPTAVPMSTTPADGQPPPPSTPADLTGDPYATPEGRAELIRKRIEERRRLMREDAERSSQEQVK